MDKGNDPLGEWVSPPPSDPTLIRVGDEQDTPAEVPPRLTYNMQGPVSFAGHHYLDLTDQLKPAKEPVESGSSKRQEQKPDVPARTPSGWIWRVGVATLPVETPLNMRPMLTLTDDTTVNPMPQPDQPAATCTIKGIKVREVEVSRKDIRANEAQSKRLQFSTDASGVSVNWVETEHESVHYFKEIDYGTGYAEWFGSLGDWTPNVWVERMEHDPSATLLPRLYVEETYGITSYFGDMGAGRPIKTISLFPGEETRLYMRSWRSSTETYEEASSVLDS